MALSVDGHLREDPRARCAAPARATGNKVQELDACLIPPWVFLRGRRGLWDKATGLPAEAPGPPAPEPVEPEATSPSLSASPDSEDHKPTPQGRHDAQTCCTECLAWRKWSADAPSFKEVEYEWK